MRLRLSQTLLSKRPTHAQLWLGPISVMLLMFIQTLDHEALAASGQAVFTEGQYWKAFTSSLVHADLTHLGHNAFFFTIFSVLLNSYFGWFMFPLVTLVMGGFINLITLWFYEPQVTLVGISGVIYFMVAFWMVLYVGIDRKLDLKRRMINATAVSLILFFPQVFEQRVSYLAHAVGFALGFGTGLVYFYANQKSIRGHEVWVLERDDDDEVEEENDEEPDYSLTEDLERDTFY